MPVATVDRIRRVNEILKREIADFLEKESLNEGGSIVSVTKVCTASNLKEAQVYISVLGKDEGDEKAKHAINMLNKHRAELQRRIAKDVILKYTPVLHFLHDKNIEEGDRILALIQEMENDQKPH